MSFKQTLGQAIASECKLRILEQLEAQTDKRLSIILLARVLDSFGYRRGRDWIETQLRALEELGAVSLSEPGGTLIARIETPGRDHLEERSVLVGVLSPAEVR